MSHRIICATVLNFLAFIFFFLGGLFVFGFVYFFFNYAYA